MKHIKDIMPLITEAISIRKRITDMILELPDNPDINPISKSPMAFTIQSSKLDRGILSPEHYTFKYQYNYFAAALLRVPIEDTLDWIETTLNRGSIKVSGQTMKLNPMVIENIRRVFNGE
jgi:hypothetical protein